MGREQPGDRGEGRNAGAGEGQLISRAVSDPTFNWLPLADGTDAYAVNGLAWHAFGPTIRIQLSRQHGFSARSASGRTKWSGTAGRFNAPNKRGAR